MDDGLIITHIDQFIEPESDRLKGGISRFLFSSDKPKIELQLRRPTGIMQTSAIPWEVFRADGQPVSEDDWKNGYFVESDLVPNPE